MIAPQTCRPGLAKRHIDNAFKNIGGGEDFEAFYPALAFFRMIREEYNTESESLQMATHNQLIGSSDCTEPAQSMPKDEIKQALRAVVEDILTSIYVRKPEETTTTVEMSFSARREMRIGDPDMADHWERQPAFA